MAALDQLASVAMDPAAQDRIGAVESLAKLKYILAADERPVIEKLAASDDDGMALFATWLISGCPAARIRRIASRATSHRPIRSLGCARSTSCASCQPDIDEPSQLKAAAQAELKDTLTHTYRRAVRTSSPARTATPAKRDGRMTSCVASRQHASQVRKSRKLVGRWANKAHLRTST
jgi:hypothetical protein